MKTLRAMLVRFAGLFRTKQHEAEMNEELRSHLDGLIERNVAAGMSPENARYAALRAFGGVEQIAERARDQRRSIYFDRWLSDLRFAFRAMGRARRFTAAVSLTLVLGFGAAMAVYCAVAPTMLYAPPYPRAGELHMLGFSDKLNAFVPWCSGVHFLAYQEQVSAFTGYAALHPRMANVVIEGDPAPAEVGGISADAFRVLGIQPALGRVFMPEEFQLGADNVVVLSHHIWRTRFCADPAVLGRQATIDGQPCTVIGVLAPGQTLPFAARSDVFRPLIIRPTAHEVFGPALQVIARLRPGVAAAEAAKALDAIRLPALPQWAIAYVAQQKMVAQPWLAETRQTANWVLLAGGVFLFAIACLNAANLLLVRILRREKELAIRLALGGSRGQVARLVALEGAIVILAVGAVVGAAVRWAYPPLFAMMRDDPVARFAVFWHADALICLGGLMAVASIAVVGVSLLRFWKAKPFDGLKSGAGAGEHRGLSRVRLALVALQAALAVILLAGTGLLMRAFVQLHRVDLGFDPAGKVKVWLEFPRGFEPKPEVRLAYFEDLRAHVGKLPGVRRVSFAQDALLNGFYGTAQLQMDDGTFLPAAGSFLPADYAATAGLRLSRGRWLSGNPGEWEVVINETLARARFGTADPLGRLIQIQVSGNRGYRVVGVVRDVKDAVRASSGMRMYFPVWMYPPNITSLLLQLEGDTGQEFAGMLRRAIYQFDPKLVTTSVTSLHAVVNDFMNRERQVYLVLRSFAAIALSMAVIGLSSVAAYTVEARTREFGVRVALGARPGDLRRQVLRPALATTAIGTALGVAIAIGLARCMHTLLFETTPYDWVVYLGVVAGVLLATCVACWMPARRAAKIDPMVALRAE